MATFFNNNNNYYYYTNNGTYACFDSVVSGGIVCFRLPVPTSGNIGGGEDTFHLVARVAL